DCHEPQRAGVEHEVRRGLARAPPGLVVAGGLSGCLRLVHARRAAPDAQAAGEPEERAARARRRAPAGAAEPAHEAVAVVVPVVVAGQGADRLLEARVEVEELAA